MLQSVYEATKAAITTAKNKLIKQGCQGGVVKEDSAGKKNISCKFKGIGRKKQEVACAIGMLIDPGLYKPYLEDTGIRRLIEEQVLFPEFLHADYDYLASMQSHHDEWSPCHGNFRSYIKNKFNTELELLETEYAHNH